MTPSENGSSRSPRKSTGSRCGPAKWFRKRGATCEILDDGSVLVKEPKADADTYTVRGSSELPRITAVRLEALPHESLPRRRAGACRRTAALSLSQGGTV